MDIYFLFSSVTFLQLYIPLVIEFNKLNFNSIFIIRKNYKEYACPYKNYNLLLKYKNEYNFQIINNIDLLKIKSVVIMVDGDIYGPPRLIGLKESLLDKLNKNVLKISLIEHMNFRWVYNYYINYVDYCIFPNKYFTDQFNFNSKKNLYLGNTKFDNIPKNEIILKKYNLIKNNKKCLILFPKLKFKNLISENLLSKLYFYLKTLNYFIIVKTRPKDNKIPLNLQGDLLISSDIYPNESIELMKISDLCILFSSSAIDETLFCEIPTIDISIDKSIERNNFIKNQNIYYELNNISNLSFNKFNNIINSLYKKNFKIYTKLKNKYLFNHTNTSKNIVDFIIKNIK